MGIKITKMSASGNDFIIMDGRRETIPDQSGLFIKNICARKLSVGADGFMVLCASEIADIGVSYFNQDASPASLCLNGLRCVAKYALYH